MVDRRTGCAQAGNCALRGAASWSDDRSIARRLYHEAFLRCYGTGRVSWLVAVPCGRGDSQLRASSGFAPDSPTCPRRSSAAPEVSAGRREHPSACFRQKAEDPTGKSSMPRKPPRVKRGGCVFCLGASGGRDILLACKPSIKSMPLPTGPSAAIRPRSACLTPTSRTVGCKAWPWK